MKKYTFIFLLTLSAVSVFAQKKIDLAPIPKALLSKANAVYREQIVDITIESPKAIIKKTKDVITILNEKGEKHTSFSTIYDSFNKIIELKATVYDKNGKRIKKYKEDDFYDHAMISDATLYQDNRIKRLAYSNLSYPHTIVYECTKKLKGSLFLPSWHPYPMEDASIVKSTYTVRVKSGLKVNFKELNLKSKGIKTQKDGFDIYHWEVKNEPTFDPEELSVPYMDIFPTVLVALDNFEMDDYEGNLSSWKTFGEWRLKLNKGRQELPEEAITEIKKLTQGITDPKEKAKKVYQYMQNRTRYVNVAIGIGGWQPFSAKTVHKNGYGDCKALTNYTRALLQTVGIRSHYSTIKAGRYKADVLTDFPSQQSNHVILCVPFEKDTVWLECTNQEMPFGFLGDFTDNRHALLITEEGGKLVRTPKYSYEENLTQLVLKIQLDLNGNIEGKMITEHTGLSYDNYSYYIRMEPEKREKRLKSRISLPVLNLKKVEYTEKKNILPKMTETIDFSSEKYATITANRMFVEINAVNKTSYIPKRIRNRRTDFEYRRGAWEKDKTEIVLPNGFSVEFMPEAFDIKSPFGHYKTSVELKGNTLHYTREFKLIEGRYKAEKWKEFRSFFQQIKKADEAKLVLQKKE